MPPELTRNGQMCDPPTKNNMFQWFGHYVFGSILGVCGRPFGATFGHCLQKVLPQNVETALKEKQWKHMQLPLTL